ncbi:hypothetical protein TWF481_010387 [Arthrobotrys musiformis]|uniref:Protein kinase domain-containing protein n=1 Tax=Arthrobotrys musiformis TaxID=47236 RepID=A0AAV9W0K9_9PEZI
MPGRANAIHDKSPGDVIYIFPLNGDTTASQSADIINPQNEKFIRSRWSKKTPGCSPKFFCESFILLSLDETPPKNKQLGWLFGYGSEADVLLGADEDDGGPEKGIHFAIAFNPSTGVLLVRNHSREGTFVYDVGNEDQVATKEEEDIGRRLRQLHGNAIQTSILGRFTQIVLGNCSFLLRTPLRSPEEDQGYQTRLSRFLESPFTGYLTPLTPTSGDTTVLSNYTLQPIRQTKPNQKSTGDVFQAIHSNTGAIYSAKYYRRSREAKDSPWQKEMELLCELHHETITPFINLIQTDREVYLLTPAPQEGSLSQHPTISWKPTDKISAIRQIIDAVNFVHQHGAAHLSIRPSKVLVMSKNPISLKLSNFGTATRQKLSRTVGIGCFAAPETISTHATSCEVQPYSAQIADMWSTGALLFSFYSPIAEDQELAHNPELLPARAAVALNKCHPISRVIIGLLVVKPGSRWNAIDCDMVCKMEDTGMLANPLSGREVGQLAPFELKDSYYESLPPTRATTEPIDDAPPQFSEAFAVAGSPARVTRSKALIRNPLREPDGAPLENYDAEHSTQDKFYDFPSIPGTAESPSRSISPLDRNTSQVLAESRLSSSQTSTRAARPRTSSPTASTVRLSQSPPPLAANLAPRGPASVPIEKESDEDLSKDPALGPNPPLKSFSSVAADRGDNTPKSNHSILAQDGSGQGTPSPASPSPAISQNQSEPATSHLRSVDNTGTSGKSPGGQNLPGSPELPCATESSFDDRGCGSQIVSSARPGSEDSAILKVNEPKEVSTSSQKPGSRRSKGRKGNKPKEKAQTTGMVLRSRVRRDP